MTLIATAFCLRAPFTCVGPLADVIQSDLGVSSSVSGIAQSVGYLMAAVGPVAVGAMHDAASDWGPGILFLICVAASLVVLGYLIGRDVVIGAPEA